MQSKIKVGNSQSYDHSEKRKKEEKKKDEGMKSRMREGRMRKKKGKRFGTSESWKYENEHCLQNELQASLFIIDESSSVRRFFAHLQFNK